MILFERKAPLCSVIPVALDPATRIAVQAEKIVKHISQGSIPSQWSSQKEILLPSPNPMAEVDFEQLLVIEDVSPDARNSTIVLEAFDPRVILPQLLKPYLVQTV